MTDVDSRYYVSMALFAAFHLALWAYCGIQILIQRRLNTLAEQKSESKLGMQSIRGVDAPRRSVVQRQPSLPVQSSTNTQPSAKRTLSSQSSEPAPGSPHMHPAQLLVSVEALSSDAVSVDGLAKQPSQQNLADSGNSSSSRSDDPAIITPATADPAAPIALPSVGSMQRVLHPLCFFAEVLQLILAIDPFGLFAYSNGVALAILINTVNFLIIAVGDYAAYHYICLWFHTLPAEVPGWVRPVLSMALGLYGTAVLIHIIARIVDYRQWNLALILIALASVSCFVTAVLFSVIRRLTHLISEAEARLAKGERRRSTKSRMTNLQLVVHRMKRFGIYILCLCILVAGFGFFYGIDAAIKSSEHIYGYEPDNFDDPLVLGSLVSIIAQYLAIFAGVYFTRFPTKYLWTDFNSLAVS